MISGSEPFRSALVSLLKERGGKLIVLPDELSEQASALGAELICK